MRVVSPKHILLPLMMLGFVGLAVTFLAPVFTTSNRWALLGLTCVYLLIKGSWWQPFRSGFGALTLIHGVWSLVTVIWSEVPMLSAMKAVAFIMVTLTCLAAGHNWARQHSLARVLDFLAPLTFVALLAGILGRFSANAVDVSGTTVMYQGLVYGSNMFGSMLAMCAPFLVWKTWLYWRYQKRRMLWLLLSAVAFYYLLAASSRAAILIVLVTLLGLFLVLSLTKRLQIVILAAGLLANVFMVAPGQFEQLQQQYLYKQATRDQGVFFTREAVWNTSYEQAIKGGWFGGGYGITIGGSKSFKGGLTAAGYGREKGNSQLAIVEETGLIGFMLYLMSIVALFARLWGGIRVALRGPEKVLLAIVTGALTGMIVGSLFEAWWVAPGAPESIFFWTLAGIGLGLTNRIFQARRAGEFSEKMAKPQLHRLNSRTDGY
jgi:O-antigen ligase